MSPTFRSLTVRNYRLYFGAAVISNIGTWMQRVAQDWLVLQLTGSASALGLTVALQFLPFVLFGPWGGIAADRYSKRRLLTITQSTMGTLALMLGVLVVTGAVQAWHVYILAFLLGTVTAFDNPARQTFVSEIVGPERLPNAVALNSASFNLARLAGPAIAGVLIAAVGTGPVFLLNALSFVATLTALSKMRSAELAPAPPQPKGKGQLAAAVRYIARRPPLLLTVVTVFFIGTFGLNFQLTMALFAKQVFDRGADSFGLLSSALAIGTLAGALGAARRGRPRIRLVVGAGVAFGALEVLCGLMPSYWTFLAMLIPTGFAAMTFITAANSTMQLGATAAMRGRVMAIYMMVFLGGTPIGAPIIGVLAQAVGPRWSLLGGGSISLIATIVIAYVIARRRGLAVRPRARRPYVALRPVADRLDIASTG
jgi:MFS family permease